MFGWRRKPLSHPYSIIDRDTEIRGPLHSRGVMEIRGFVIGEIVHRGNLVVAPGGICTGNVQADELYLRGEVHGDVAVTGTLRIGNGGQLFGDASCRRLIIDAGGRFVGKNLSGSEEESPAEAPAGLATGKPAPEQPKPVPLEPEPVHSASPPVAEVPQGSAPVQPEPVRFAPPPSAAEVPPGPAPAPPAQEPAAIVFHGFMRTKR